MNTTRGLPGVGNKVLSRDRKAAIAFMLEELADHVSTLGLEKWKLDETVGKIIKIQNEVER